MWFSDSDVCISEDEFYTLFSGEVAIVVNGNLEVLGNVSVDDFQSLQVSGNVKCKTFWIGEGVFECETLEAKQFAEFVCDETQHFETLDISTLKAPVILCPSIEVDELASDVEYEFADIEVDDEIKSFDRLMASQFEVVYTALKGGALIDDAWVLENEHLVPLPNP